MSERIRLRARAPIKPPPPGVKLATALPRQEPLSLKEIVERTHESSAKHLRSTVHSLEQQEAILAKAEEALRAREHSIRQRETLLFEQERESLELIKLAEARELQAERKESMLVGKEEQIEQATRLSRMHRELVELRQEKFRLVERLGETQAELEEQIKVNGELRISRSALQRSERTSAEEQAEEANIEALLAERQIFIEKSENTLFHRAQELHELELYLENWQDTLEMRAKELGLEDTRPAEISPATPEA